MKHLLLIVVLLNLCSCDKDKPLFKSWLSGSEGCNIFCEDQDTNVLRYSGVCLCDSEHGHLAEDGYLKELQLKETK